MTLDVEELPVGSQAEIDPQIETPDHDAVPGGSLRPEPLVSARRRQDRRLAGHRFRTVDMVVLLATTIYFLSRISAGSLFDMALADAIPVIAGTWTTWTMAGGVGLYRFGRSERLLKHFTRVAVAAGAGVVVALVLQALVPARQTELSDILQLGAFCGGGLAALNAIRWILVGRWRSNGQLTPNVVVVGATNHAEDLISTAIDRQDMNILGVFDDREDRSPLAMLGVPVLGTTDSMLGHRLMPYVDLVVVTIDPTASARVREITRRLAVLPNPITLLFDDETASRRSDALEQIADAPLAPPRSLNDGAGKAFVKRALDLAIGGIALVLFAPVMLIAAAAVKVDSTGPVFFRQRRQGFNNEEISVWKFRSMSHADADPRAAKQVTADDIRVTRVGRILRSTSLDELPQLFNVIIGEMSLVGPRPHAIGMKTGDVESAALVAEYAHRHRIKPGMTGWAAINGSRGPLHDPADVSRRVALDIDYIEHQSLWLDLRIMLKTIPSMLGDRAAIR